MTSSTSRCLHQPRSLFEFAAITFSSNGYSVPKVGIREVTLKVSLLDYFVYRTFVDTCGLFVDIPLEFLVFNNGTVDLTESILNAGSEAVPKKGNILNPQVGRTSDAHHVMNCFVKAATVQNDARSTQVVHTRARHVLQWCLKRERRRILATGRTLAMSVLKL